MLVQVRSASSSLDSWKTFAAQERSFNFPHNQYSKEGVAEASRGPRIFLCGGHKAELERKATAWAFVCLLCLLTHLYLTSGIFIVL